MVSSSDRSRPARRGILTSMPRAVRRSSASEALAVGTLSRTAPADDKTVRGRDLEDTVTDHRTCRSQRRGSS